MLLLYSMALALLINMLVNRQFAFRVPHIRLVSLALGGAALQALSALSPERPADLRLVMWALGAAFVATALYANREVPGVRLILTGLMLNALVILVNEGMPVAATQSGSAMYDVYRHMDSSTLMPWLGDALPDPTLLWLMSPGDVLMAVGTAVALSIAPRQRAS